MLIDMTLKITRSMLTDALQARNQALIGHIGTHFDVMNKEFPLSYTERDGIVFDVRHISGRDIDTQDIDLNTVEKDMFVAFCTGFLETEGYGGHKYFTEHPQLSVALIDALLEKGVSIIGLDFAGVRRTPEHIPTDQLCADQGVFIIENLCNLKDILQLGGRFTACTYPLNCAEMTGLPCRVIAKVPPQSL